MNAVNEEREILWDGNPAYHITARDEKTPLMLTLLLMRFKGLKLANPSCSNSPRPTTVTAKWGTITLNHFDVCSAKRVKNAPKLMLQALLNCCAN